MVTVFDFPSGHTLLCGGSLANSVELPIVIRGHEANIFFHGPDQRRPDYLILEAEASYADTFREKVKKAGLEGLWLSEQGSASGYAQMSRAQREAWIAGVLGEAPVREAYESELKNNPKLQNDARLRDSYFGALSEKRSRAARHRPRLRIDSPPAPSFMEIFLECVRTRGKPAIDGQLGYMSQVAIVMAVRSWQENKAMFFDTRTEKVSESPTPA
jgi:hypothetical protein